MSTPILTTKLFAPPAPQRVVLRPKLIERLNNALKRSPAFTLISAPAGFGKTTLASEWAAACERRVAWLSLDEGDNDPRRFLGYVVAALRTISPDVGGATLAMLQSPQPSTPQAILTTLLNEISTIPENFAFVLDDYHVIDAQPVDYALASLIEHLPSRMHLVITTREDPQLPLARLRSTGRLTELRITDLRFTNSEAAEFLNQVMGLSLSAEDIAALEARTEGWIAGLQLAAISMQGHPDVTSFIKSFTGSHHFVMDYLVEEVLQRQSEAVQTFLLRTSILDRLCGPLCDAVLLDASASGQRTLEYLEHANLFIIALDNERRWYRYHHLFADLLRQRLRQSDSSPANERESKSTEYHRRASAWYEENELELEAFQHATAASDFERAERLIEGKGMPLHFRGAVAPVLNWLESLPATVLADRPSLLTALASTLLVTGQTTRVEPALQAAEAALQRAESNDKTRDLTGRVAAIRATAAVSQNQIDTIITQSRLALEYLHSDNVAFRTSTAWKLGFAYHLQGNRTAAGQAYSEVVSIGRTSGNTVFTLMAMIGLGLLQEGNNRLHEAAETYRRVLQLIGDPPLPFACEAHLGLARISYQWNELDEAHLHAQKSAQLARQVENNDRYVACEVFLARLELARGDTRGASATLANAAHTVRQHDFVQRMPEVVDAQLEAFLREGNLAAAAQLAEKYEVPIGLARVRLAQQDPSAALSVLEPLRSRMEANGWEDEMLKAMLLEAIALDAFGRKENALQLLSEALALAEPGGFLRIFIDEGKEMGRLLSETAAKGLMPDYIGRVLTAFEIAGRSIGESPGRASAPAPQPLVEPLSPRELEVLRLIADGLSNREIGERLFVALITVKGHNQRIFGKLGVQRRTEAVARARDLGLL